MRTPFVAAFLGLLAAGLAPQSASAAAAANAKVLVVDNGINKFTVGKHQVVAVRAWRENGNAHGFDVVTFYEVNDRLNLFAGKNPEKEEFSITASGGADCQLHDFRFVQAQGRQPARLVVAERDFGESYSDTAAVHFTWYDLVEATMEFGPRLYFEVRRKTDSPHKYCDVNEAFDKELHLGAHGKAGD
jgi:hypothetical protein